MTDTIEKVEERHTKNEIMKRDGETGMAVGIFVMALGLPVLIGTLWALDNPRAALVNAICGLVLLAIGGTATAYSRHLYIKAQKNDGA
jgi:hypothetical protein